MPKKGTLRSWQTSAAAMATALEEPPKTMEQPMSMSSVTLSRVRRTSEAESLAMSRMRRPRIPPWLLISSTASCEALIWSRPSTEYGPVRG